MAKLRKVRGWSAQELARRLEEAGAPHLNRWVLANLESGRRESVSIDEVLVLAHVLSVAPVHLFIDAEGRWMEVGNQSIPPDMVREWVRGKMPLRGEDPVLYKDQVPEWEWERVPIKSLDELLDEQQVLLRELLKARERETAQKITPVKE